MQIRARRRVLDWASRCLSILPWLLAVVASTVARGAELMPYFGRIVFDPNANFSGHDMLRLGFGLRF
jgi:hypothetical protein